jgi:hypothetical protein
MTSWKFDFGDGDPEAGYVGVDASTPFSPERGFGWVSACQLQVRDRNLSDRLLGRFVLGTSPATLRVAVDPGRYLVRLIMGDKDFGNHVLQLGVGDTNEDFPLLTAEASECAILEAVIEVPTSPLDLTFASPGVNWVLNSITLEPDEGQSGVAPHVVRQRFGNAVQDSPEAEQIAAEAADIAPPATLDYGRDVGEGLTADVRTAAAADIQENVAAPEATVSAEQNAEATTHAQENVAASDAAASAKQNREPVREFDLAGEANVSEQRTAPSVSRGPGSTTVPGTSAQPGSDDVLTKLFRAAGAWFRRGNAS